MQFDAFATSLMNQLSPELLVASLLVLASLCFFCGALVLLLVIRPRLNSPAPALAQPAVDAPPAHALAVAAPKDERRRNRLTRRRGGSSLPTQQDGVEGRDFSREILLAQQGSDAQQLMKSCGLSQLEANLVVKLYGHAGPPSRAVAAG